MSRSVPYRTSPLLTSKTPLWRSRLLVAATALGFCALAARAAWVQVIDNDFFLRQGEVRFARTLEMPATRGRILDRNGLLLAASVPAQSVWAIPEDIDASPEQLAQLALLLDLPLPELQRRLADEDKNFVWLKRQLDQPQAARIAALKLDGIYLRKEYKRQYPEGEAAAQLVGFTDSEGKGQEGLELALDTALAGSVGSRRVIKDRLGRVVEDMGQTVLPVEGKDVQLTLDSKIQFFAYQQLRAAVQEHKAKAGSVVVLDAQTGQLLALANYPSFAPEKRQSLGAAAVRNRALTDAFEPGSTLKPFIAALALEKGLVRPETPMLVAPGRITIGNATIHDAHPYEVLSVSEVIQKSSNVGTVKLAMRMQAREMWELYAQLGLGRKPAVNLPGSTGGKLRPYKSWRPIEQATIGYGYGVSTSLVQLAQAYTVFATDGEWRPASLLKDREPAPGVRVISAEHARAVRQMLHLATSSGGTAPGAQALGYSVGGKTGTARKQEGKGYADKKYRSSFVGLAPLDKPRIIVAVMIDEPSGQKYTGGEVAAPVFSATVQHSLRLLGVAPDMAVTPQIVAQAAPESH